MLATQPKGMTWAGWILTAIVGGMLTFSAVTKFTGMADEEFTRLGYANNAAMIIGTIEILCALIYLFPKTAVLGAVLLTGYLGGATATHVRIHDPFIGPVIGGVLVWLAVYLRDPRVRAILPWMTDRKQTEPK
jgi:hypothetical protein